MREWALANLSALVANYGGGVELRHGRGICPIHGGDNPEAFSVTDGKGWHCWTGDCGGGDGVDFVRRMLFAGLPDKEGRLAALRELAPLAGVFLKERGRNGARGPRIAQPTRNPTRPAIVAHGGNAGHGSHSASIGKAASAATKAPEENALENRLQELACMGYVVQRRADINAAVLSCLTLTERGAEYLASRGLDPAAAELYGFRSVDSLAAWRELGEILRASYLPEELEAAGWHSLPWWGKVPALVIPYSYRGEVVALRFRRLDGVEADKYRALKSVEIPLPFNADALDLGADGGELHITEGELDAYTLAAHGLQAVGVPGATTWRDEWTARVATVGRLVAWYDCDAAGAKGRAKLAATLAKAMGREWLTAHGRGAQLPNGSDINDLHRAGKLAALIERGTWRAQ